MTFERNNLKIYFYINYIKVLFICHESKSYQRPLCLPLHGGLFPTRLTTRSIRQ